MSIRYVKMFHRLVPSFNCFDVCLIFCLFVKTRSLFKWYVNCSIHYDKMTIDTWSVKAICEMSFDIVKLAQLLCEKVYYYYYHYYYYYYVRQAKLAAKSSNGWCSCSFRCCWDFVELVWTGMNQLSRNSTDRIERPTDRPTDRPIIIKSLLPWWVWQCPVGWE